LKLSKFGPGTVYILLYTFISFYIPIYPFIFLFIPLYLPLYFYNLIVPSIFFPILLCGHNALSAYKETDSVVAPLSGSKRKIYVYTLYIRFLYTPVQARRSQFSLSLPSLLYTPVQASLNQLPLGSVPFYTPLLYTLLYTPVQVSPHQAHSLNFPFYIRQSRPPYTFFLLFSPFILPFNISQSKSPL
jgi:hypothetical protein